MLDEKIKILVKGALQEADLWSVIDESRSQFLEVGHLFAHLVLRDAARYESVVRAMAELGTKLQNRGEKLEFLVRSSWQVTGVDYLGAYYDKDRTPKAASCLLVLLQSGSRVHSLRVAFSEMAGRAMQEQRGAARNDYAKHRTDMVECTKEFIQLLLSGRGTSNAWDPLWVTDDLEINLDALNWIRSKIARRKS